MIENRQPLVCARELACARGYSILQVFILKLERSLEVVELKMRFDPGVELRRIGKA